jgi:transposase
LPQFKGGKNIKTTSIITDENVQSLFRATLRSMKDEDRTPKSFCEILNNDLLATIPNAKTSVSVETARVWMIYLGFKATLQGKGYYTDGHNRADVVTYRREFLNRYFAFQTKMKQFEGENMEIEINPILEEGEQEVVFITHDESTFYCNEGKRLIWMENGKKKILPKSKGTSIMISGFVCKCHGFMINGNQKSYKLFEAGNNRDGWFTNDDLVQQFENCKDLFTSLHPNCKILVGFDNSMSHHKKSPDGLDARQLNLSDGGVNQRTVIRDGWFIDENGERVIQKMHLTVQSPTGMIKGDQKGLKTILMERNKSKNNRGHNLLKICDYCSKVNDKEERDYAVLSGYIDEKCCATYVLSQEPDFLEQKEWLSEVVEAAGFDIIYFPKYHCELNFIEMIWGWIKAFHRRTCTYSYNDLKSNLPDTVENRLPIAFIRRASRSCERFMTGYDIGLEGPELDFAMRKYKGHRNIPSSMKDLIKQQFKVKLLDRKRKFN